MKQGDRVILSHERYIPTPEFPVWGSQYECIGTVTNVSDSGQVVYVQWDNGVKEQYYYLDTLSLADGTPMNPNSAFRIKKRRLR